MGEINNFLSINYLNFKNNIFYSTTLMCDAPDFWPFRLQDPAVPLWKESYYFKTRFFPYSL